MPAASRPFTLRVSNSAISDLQARLDLTRFPDQTPGEPWAFGTDLAFMERLVAYWHHEFDWRPAEAELNAFPQFTVPIDGIDLHFIRAEGKGHCCPAQSRRRGEPSDGRGFVRRLLPSVAAPDLRRAQDHL